MNIYKTMYHAQTGRHRKRKAHIVGGGIAGLAAQPFWSMMPRCPGRTSPSWKSLRL